MNDKKMISDVTTIDKFLNRTFLKIIPRWVTPNDITKFRFLTLPFVVWLLVSEQFFLGLILFSISAFSDALDGALARTTGQITDWGKLFDPLADKLLIGTTALILIPMFINVYLALIIVIIELGIILISAYKKHYLGITVFAHTSGKIKMILQSLGIGAIFIFAIFGNQLFLVFAEYSLYAAIAFAIMSIVYRSA